VKAAAKKVSVFVVQTIGTALPHLGRALKANHLAQLLWAKKRQIHEIKSQFVIVAIPRS